MCPLISFVSAQCNGQDTGADCKINIPTYLLKLQEGGYLHRSNMIDAATLYLHNLTSLLQAQTPIRTNVKGHMNTRKRVEQNQICIVANGSCYTANPKKAKNH